MTIMWSACSFSNYLLNFLNKYLEGSIFTNNYYEGIAGILATAAVSTLYAKLGKKKAFTVSFSLALIGGTMIFLLESGIYQPPVSFVNSFQGS
jgi:Na+/melibiose symporter-like transporter